MISYGTVAVGTDGSRSSYRAVSKAGALARDAGATLLIICAYSPMDERDVTEAADVLGDEAYQVMGSSPAEETLRTAVEHAQAAGAASIRTVARQGKPVETLLKETKDAEADLLVVGNKGLNSLGGRLLGSVPADITRRSPCDVLIVHTKN